MYKKGDRVELTYEGIEDLNSISRTDILTSHYGICQDDVILLNPNFGPHVHWYDQYHNYISSSGTDIRWIRHFEEVEPYNISKIMNNLDKLIEKCLK